LLSVDIELALVGLTAMLEPATLLYSVLALVIGDRPLRTNFWGWPHPSCAMASQASVPAN
jgi:hypothetical protein